MLKGEIISDRMPPSASDPLAKDRDLGIATANYGRDFKDRKFLTLQSMKDFGFGAKTLEDTVVEEVSFLIKRFKEEADTNRPTDVHQSVVHLAVSNVISRVVFGRRFSYDDSKFLLAVDGIRFLFTQSTFFLRKIPLVKYLPSVQREWEIESSECIRVYRRSNCLS